jgi:flagellar basal-body rod modification protein FlgD
MDPSEFLGQLAQFSTVSGIQGMQDSISTLSDSMRSAQVLDGSTMIGRDVLVTADDASLSATGSISGAVDMPEGASSAQISIKNSAGTLVRTIPVSSTTGLQEFTWDGATSEGERAAAGSYTIDVVANVGGANESLQTMLSDRVNSVTIDATKGLTLNTTSLGPRSLSDVRRVM